MVPALRSLSSGRSEQGVLQIAGGHKYLPPRQDTNAPDLYIPLVAMTTYVMMAAMVAVRHQHFSPSTLYSLVGPCVRLATGSHAILCTDLVALLAVLYATPRISRATTEDRASVG